MKGGKIVTVNEANQYIQKNRNKVNNMFRHNYHVMAPVGWINDPNGFCIYNNEYHLFYQFYPYDSEWGPVHWGHVKSKDLVKWEELPVALAPDQEYDAGGCFSGSAIQIGSELYLMYTGNIEPDKNDQEKKRQVQCLAKSADGIKFEKIGNNPVISCDEIPVNTRVQDFRDPKIWKFGDKFYAVIGSRTKDDKGQILFYTSEDLIKWKNINSLSIDDFGLVWECPDVFSLEERDVLILSSQYIPEEKSGSQNIYACIAMMGKFNYETCDFKPDKYQLLDCGFDFYAPQTLKTADGRRILIAWMDMWQRKSPLHELGHNWRGAMTLPRELIMKNDRLYQLPVREIRNYRKNDEVIYGLEVFDEFQLKHIKLKSHEFYIELDDMEGKVLNIDLFRCDDEAFRLIIDGIKHEIILDRGRIGYLIESLNRPGDYIRRQPVTSLRDGIRLNIFVDVSSIEIFINDGEYVMTSLVYPKKEGYISFRVDRPVILKEFKKWDICL